MSKTLHIHVHPSDKVSTIIVKQSSVSSFAGAIFSGLTLAAVSGAAYILHNKSGEVAKQAQNAKKQAAKLLKDILEEN